MQGHSAPCRAELKSINFYINVNYDRILDK
jgi:hypothetical protein